MKRLSQWIGSATLALVIALGASACAAPTETISVSDTTVVIDVRTPEEFAAGHLDGAINIDVQSPTFDSAAAELPTDGDYVVYCRTGARAAGAIDRLQDLGFTSLTNAGGLETAADATELPITK
ncbi:MAG TPA: rhodanese-like domain-containing protein [Glaciihabitans sp.]|jgi:rhodanese-related sulfurtransferase|nr:rhodanese-like domain-containing protein [Glaciihabitans sp.]